MPIYVPGGAQSGSSVATRAYRATSNQSITTSTHTAVSLNAEEFDDASLHDNSTNPSRFTIGATGRYRIEGEAYFGANAIGDRLVFIWKNGTGTGTRLAQMGGRALSTANARLVVTTGVVALTAGDYVELGVWQDSGGALDVVFGADNTWMSLERLS